MLLSYAVPPMQTIIEKAATPKTRRLSAVRNVGLYRKRKEQADANVAQSIDSGGIRKRRR
jgi:hypothetical protein